MTRKDYVLLAGAMRACLNGDVRESDENGQRDETMEAYIADALQQDNPRFDREHFLAVVRGEKALESRPERRNQ